VLQRTPMVELANATNSVKGSTNRGTIAQARTASPIFEGVYPFHERRFALRFKANRVAI